MIAPRATRWLTPEHLANLLKLTESISNDKTFVLQITFKGYMMVDPEADNDDDAEDYE